MPTFRLAQRADVPELARLLGVLFSQEHEFTPDLAVQSRGLLMLLDEGERARIAVAEADGQIVGMAILHYSISTALGRKAATLEDVIVKPEFRGRGVGKTLLAYVIEQARTDGAARITLLTDHDNASGQAFYAAGGFTRSRMVPYRHMLAQSLTV